MAGNRGSMELSARIRIKVQSREQVLERFAGGMSSGGMYIPLAQPPDVDSLVTVEFVLPDRTVLVRTVARVVHAKRALTVEDRNAGIGVQFVHVDGEGRKLISEYRARGGARPPKDPSATQVRAETLGAEAAAKGVSSAGAEGPVLGIDLGTTYSCVAVVQNGAPRVLTYEGRDTVPSVVFVTTDKRVIVGQKAVEKMVLQPDRGIYGSKRFIGRPYASREVGTFGHFFTYGLAAGPTGTTAARVDHTLVPLETVAAYILAWLRKIAKRNIGYDVRRAVITVPAYFGENQRQAVRQAGLQAGLVVERVLSEPTAAAVAFGYGRGLSRTVLVYDLGGGTFDATVLRVEGDRMEVLATDGDPFLGGCDFDDRLTEYILSQVAKIYGVDIRHDPVAVQRVKLGAELAKRDLSSATVTTLEIPFLTVTAAGPLSVSLAIRRELLHSITNDLVTRTLNIVEAVMRAARVQASDVDDVIMVGGQSRSPQIGSLLQQRFGRSPSRNVHPDHAVAMGAAIVGAAIDQAVPLALSDVLPSSLRVADRDGTTRVLFERGRKLPARMDIELETVQDDTGTEFRLELFSGEEHQASANTPVGRVRLPSNLALAFAKTRAPVTIEVDAQGLMRVTAKHPITQRVEKLEVSLAESDGGGEDVLDVTAMTDEVSGVDRAGPAL